MIIPLWRYKQVLAAGVGVRTPRVNITTDLNAQPFAKKNDLNRQKCKYIYKKHHYPLYVDKNELKN
jgi:hypothetical protein